MITNLPGGRTMNTLYPETWTDSNKNIYLVILKTIDPVTQDVSLKYYEWSSANRCWNNYGQPFITTEPATFETNLVTLAITNDGGDIDSIDWGVNPGLMAELESAVAINPYSEPAYELMGNTKFKNAYNALYGTSISTPAINIPAQMKLSFVEPAKSKQKRVIPENKTAQYCVDCGKATKEIVLFTTSTRYCPDCE